MLQAIGTHSSQSHILGENAADAVEAIPIVPTVVLPGTHYYFCFVLIWFGRVRKGGGGQKRGGFNVSLLKL